MRDLETLPRWRLWALTLIAWALQPWPFSEPGKLGAYRQIVKGE